MLTNFFKKMDKLARYWNIRGIPAPTFTDPQTDKGSITVSLVIFSAGLCAFCIGIAISTVISSLTGWFVADASLEAIKEAFWMSFQMLLASMGMYLGRRIGRAPDGTINVEPEDAPADTEKSDDEAK